MTYYSGPDLARSFRVVRNHTVQIAQEIPDEHYGFRVTAETRTVAELLAHIAAQSGYHHRLHGVDKLSEFTFEAWGRYQQDVTAFERSLAAKDDIVGALERQGDAFASWLETLTDTALGEIVTFPPPLQPSTKTRFEMLLGAKEHEMHHRAQLMVMQRLIGLVPHLTRARQQRSAATTAAR